MTKAKAAKGRTCAVRWRWLNGRVGSHAEVESLEQGLQALFKQVFQELQELTFRLAKIRKPEKNQFSMIF